jgi:hypothetical protein
MIEEDLYFIFLFLFFSSFCFFLIYFEKNIFFKEKFNQMVFRVKSCNNDFYKYYVVFLVKKDLYFSAGGNQLKTIFMIPNFLS